MSIDLSFLSSPSRCALCGREVTIEDAIVLERTAPDHVEVVTEGTSMSVHVVSGERLVVCAQCGPPEVWPSALFGGG